MLRAARFAAQLGFTVAPEVLAAMRDMAERIKIVSAERVRDELSKLLLAPDPRRGLALLTDTGLAEYVLPELPKLRLEIDEHHRHKDVYEHTLTVVDQAIALEDDGPDLVLRLAALMHDVGKPGTRKHEPGGGVSFHHHELVGAKLAKKRLRALKYPNDFVDDVARLVELHLRFHGYGDGEWTDSAVRRYVRDAGPLLSRLHKLTRSDCTTRNRRRAAALAATYDALEERIERLREQEELDAIRPDLDGNQNHGAARRGAGPGGRPRLQAPAGAAPRPGAAGVRSGRQRTAGGGGRSSRSIGTRRRHAEVVPVAAQRLQPIPEPGDGVAGRDDDQHRVGLAGLRQAGRGERGRQHEGPVEDHVVEHEDPSAELVVHGALHQRVGADLLALRRHAQQQRPGQQRQRPEGQAEQQFRDGGGEQAQGDPHLEAQPPGRQRRGQPRRARSRPRTGPPRGRSRPVPGPAGSGC